MDHIPEVQNGSMVARHMIADLESRLGAGELFNKTGNPIFSLCCAPVWIGGIQNRSHTGCRSLLQCARCSPQSSMALSFRTDSSEMRSRSASSEISPTGTVTAESPW